MKYIAQLVPTLPMERKSTAKVNPAAMTTASLTRHKLHEDISENEQRYRDLVEHLPVCIAVLCDGKVTFINESGARMMGGQKPDDIVGLSVLDFVHEDFKESVIQRNKQVLKGIAAPPMEEKFVRLDGKVIDVEVSSYPFIYQNKPAAQVIVKDITEQKESRVAAKKSETLFSQLFHVSPMAIVMLDNDGNVAQVNPGFEKMFGYTFAELKCKGLNQFIVPDSLESEGNDLNSLISTDRKS